MPISARSIFAFAFMCLTICTAHASDDQKMQFFSRYADLLNETCRDGYVLHSNEAHEKKSFCIGFLYAVMLRLELDKEACFGADIGPMIEAASRILMSAKPRDDAWVVLRNGFRKQFPCKS